MTKAKKTPSDVADNIAKLEQMISLYEGHLERALNDGIENLAEVFKLQIKILKANLDKEKRLG